MDWSEGEIQPDYVDQSDNDDEPVELDEEDVESRVLSIIDEVKSSFSFDDFVKSRGESYTSSNDIGKNITTEMVESQVEAARAASKLFDEGRDEEARAKFGPDCLDQLMEYKRKLGIYISPFLQGMRYTSFGRRFTKLEKLEEIVERLHCYVQNGDTIVDFSCGSNDWSCLMKDKLEKTGKSCHFKNFDIILPKSTFNFEKRDWLSVKKEELTYGSRLIMGLSPPFGSKSRLAETFIKKALQFRPKILILIVPSEAKRVDAIADYDLIWEDTNLLSGKSFYLPGSIDRDNKTIEHCYDMPPPLYLWSRKDWTMTHKAIALQQGHITHQNLQQEASPLMIGGQIAFVEDEGSTTRGNMGSGYGNRNVGGRGGGRSYGYGNINVGGRRGGRSYGYGNINVGGRGGGRSYGYGNRNVGGRGEGRSYGYGNRNVGGRGEGRSYGYGNSYNRGRGGGRSFNRR